MLTRIHITVLILLAAAVWAAMLSALELPVTWEYTRPFAFTVTVLSAVSIAFEKWVWRWPIFRGWLVHRVDLQGTWKVKLVSSWVDPATGKQVAPIDCIMVIRQSFSTFSARLFTKESSSFLVASKLVRQNDGVFQLFGVYQNTPDVSLRGQRSEIHYGALLLEVRGEPPTSMTGHYWTDRGTRGSLELAERTPELLSGYAEGMEKLNALREQPPA